MADRFVFCSVCGDDTLHTVSGSGRHKSCWDCKDREFRRKAVRRWVRVSKDDEYEHQDKLEAMGFDV